MAKSVAEVLRGRVEPAAWNSWRWQLANSITHIEQLHSWLTDPALGKDALRDVIRRYPLRVTPYYLSLSDKADPRDPLGLQCIPDEREITLSEGLDDPFGECLSSVPGLIQRYANRVVILVNNACAVNCRHCTRKNQLGCSEWSMNHDRLRRVVDTIAERPEIREVIVSGGEPLLLDDAELDDLLTALRAVKHVKVLRIGTRTPVVLPMRITPQLACVLARHRPLWVNTQFNHPGEITPDSIQACSRLIESGIPVSNQCVLLRGINDSYPVLAELCNRLQAMMVRPYYLFQCDPVKGTSHFRVPLREGMRLSEQLRATLGGLSVPTFVADVPGSSGKIPLNPSHVQACSESEAIIDDYEGRVIHYPDSK